ncbi:hypothetical protein [Paralysiella testudinis]|uniref:Uncharacterized protein n=1 Tax=Paralysiella testudinis TaxID=2809020 RepID=A0A892ZHA1_9NEIS|nr:hypothetical protein [Paralysiella testudinis]QRQ82531.1 hypothetical protein JQU52_03790 [Paralysiella testudinis]
MGYQVGGQCFGTVHEASNYKMSQVLPTITADGGLKTPVYHGGQWYYAEQPINLSFPECNLEAEFKDGVLVAIPLVALMLIAYLFRLITRLFRKSFEEKDVF